MDLVDMIPNEISQTEKDKYCMLLHVESKEKYNKFVNVTKQKKTDVKYKLVVTSGQSGGTW